MFGLGPPADHLRLQDRTLRVRLLRFGSLFSVDNSGLFSEKNVLFSTEAIGISRTRLGPRTSNFELCQADKSFFFDLLQGSESEIIRTGGGTYLKDDERASMTKRMFVEAISLLKLSTEQRLEHFDRETWNVAIPFGSGTLSEL